MPLTMKMKQCDEEVTTVMVVCGWNTDLRAWVVGGGTDLLIKLFNGLRMYFNRLSGLSMSLETCSLKWFNCFSGLFSNAVISRRLWHPGRTKLSLLFLRLKEFKEPSGCVFLNICLESLLNWSTCTPLWIYSDTNGPRSTDTDSGVKLGASRTETSSRPNTQWNYSIVRFYLVHKGTKKAFFFLKLRVSLASQPLVVKVERIPI